MQIARTVTMFVMMFALIQGGVADQSKASAESQAEQVVKHLEQSLIGIMRSSGDFQDRFETIRPVVNESMAIERMARFLFGRDWRDFDKEQRERFKKNFLEMSAATYANRFDEYNGEQFSAVETRRQGEDRILVRRQLTTGSGQKVAFDYLMTRTDEGWQIVTIITDGVSDLAIKRGQYRRLLDESGFEAVIDRIEESIANQRSG